MKKGLVIFGIIAVGAAILIGTFIYLCRDQREENINKLVNENYKKLEEVAKGQLEGQQVDLPEGIEIDHIEVYAENFVEFATSGKEGFYYSKNDKPMANKNREADLIELGGNKYRWQDISNTGITNKIRKNWYYYKVTK